MAAKARASARDRLVAETSTKMAPTMPNAAPPRLDRALENLPGLFRHVDRVGE